MCLAFPCRYSTPIRIKVDTSTVKKGEPSNKRWSGKSLSTVLSCVDAEEDAEKTAANSILGIDFSRIKSGVTTKKQEMVVFIGNLRNSNHTNADIKPSKEQKKNKHPLFQMKGRWKLHQYQDREGRKDEIIMQGKSNKQKKEPPVTKIPEKHVIKPPPNPKFPRLIYNILY
jgi:hypothetical protein